MTSQRVRDEIALRLDLGWSLEDVDRTLIEPATEMSEEDRDALWLLAWSYPRHAMPVPHTARSAIAG